MEFCREDLGYMTSVFTLGLLITIGTNLKLSMYYFKTYMYVSYNPEQNWLREIKKKNTLSYVQLFINFT